MIKLLIGLVALDICLSISNHLKLKKIMTKQERFDAMMERLNTTTNDIAADYKLLLDAVKNNDTVSDESLQKAEDNIAKLEALGASVENPVPGADGGETGSDTGDGADSGSDSGSDSGTGSGEGGV
jgi:hypothetical protein